MNDKQHNPNEDKYPSPILSNIAASTSQGKTDTIGPNSSTQQHQPQPIQPGVSMTSLFASSKIKKILQRDPDVARLRAPALELINTASALFLQDLVQQSVTVAAAAKAADKGSSNSNSGPIDLVITMDAIQNAMTANPQQFQFLQDAPLLGNGTHQSDNNDDVRIFTPNRKRPSRATTLNKRATATTSTTDVTTITAKPNDIKLSSSLDAENCNKKPKATTIKGSRHKASPLLSSPDLQEAMDLAGTVVAADPEATSNFSSSHQEIEADESDYD